MNKIVLHREIITITLPFTPSIVAYSRKCPLSSNTRWKIKNKSTEYIVIHSFKKWSPFSVFVNFCFQRKIAVCNLLRASRWLCILSVSCWHLTNKETIKACEISKWPISDIRLLEKEVWLCLGFLFQHKEVYLKGYTFSTFLSFPFPCFKLFVCAFAVCGRPTANNDLERTICNRFQTLGKLPKQKG